MGTAFRQAESVIAVSMLSNRTVQGARACSRAIQVHGSRNFGATAAAQQKAAANKQPTDPIQKLFIEKIREYGMKSKSAGGKLVDATPDVQTELSNELEKIDRMFGATGPDFLKFPKFDFKDNSLQAVDVKAERGEPEPIHVFEEEEIDEIRGLNQKYQDC